MEEVLNKIKEYIDTRVRLSKLILIEKGASIVADAITSVIILIFLVLAFLFVSLALGFYLSELLGNTYGGFFIVSLFYFLIAVIVILMKDKYLHKSITDKAIKKIFKGEGQE